MHRSRSVLARTLLVIFALCACSRVESPRPTPVTEHYRLVADGATLPLLRALTDAYTAEVNPYVIFTLDSGGPAYVAERLRSGQVQLGAASLAPPPLASAQWWLMDLVMDGVAVIVHPQNPISEISSRDLRDIFSGVRNHWRDYGVESLGNVEVAVREDGDGTRSKFDQTIMGDQRLTFDALVMPSIETMLNYVALKPGAIGYVPNTRVSTANRGAANEARLDGAPAQPVAAPAVKALILDGKAPSVAHIASGEYPLSRTLSLISLREPQGELRNFVAWALGPRGKAIAESLGYAPIP